MQFCTPRHTEWIILFTLAWSQWFITLVVLFYLVFSCFHDTWCLPEPVRVLTHSHNARCQLLTQGLGVETPMASPWAHLNPSTTGSQLSPHKLALRKHGGHRLGLSKYGKGITFAVPSAETLVLLAWC